MAMGRTRTRDKHLPRGVYRKHGAYWLVRKDGDKRKWIRLGAAYTEALAQFARILASAAPLTVAAVVARYELEEMPKKAATSTRNERYRLPFLLKVFGAMAPADIEPHHVWGYWRERGESPAARHEIALLSTLLTFARRIGALSKPNPCFGLNLPGSPKRKRYVTDAEFLTVRALAPRMVAHAMNLALTCGMDRSTILSLERRNITDKGIEFKRRKTGEDQVIPWDADLREVVDAIQRETPRLRAALVCTRHGKPYTADGFKALWHRTMDLAVNGKKDKDGKWVREPVLAEWFTFHDLRAKSASDADSDQDAADRLGHQTTAVTRRHYRRLPRMAKPHPLPREKQVE